MKNGFHDCTIATLSVTDNPDKQWGFEPFLLCFLAFSEAYITTNKNAVPNDPRSPFVTSGLRIGTPAVTTRGFAGAECEQLAGWLCDVLDALETGGSRLTMVCEQVREQVAA